MCENDNEVSEKELLDGKKLVKIASDYTDTVAEDLVKYANDNFDYKDLDFTKAKSILQGKAFVLDYVLSWDNSRSYDENLVYISGVVAQGFVLGLATGGLALLGAPALLAFGVGVAAGVGLDALETTPQRMNLHF